MILRFKVFIVLSLAAICFSSTAAYAGVDSIADFYNGLASIIESDTKNSKACVSKSKAFIEENVAGLYETMERNRQRASSIKRDEDANWQENIKSDPELAREMEAGTEAMNRFADAISAFAENNPKEADVVLDYLGSFKPGVE